MNLDLSTLGAARLVIFAKSAPIAHGAGLTLVHETDKNGKAAPRWKHNGPIIKAPKQVAHAKFSAAAHFKKYDHDGVTAEEIVAKHSEGAKEHVEDANARLTNLPSTEDQHKINGEWTPERKREHQKIINKFLSNGKIKRATPKPGEKPTFTILGGRGGSGKSWFKGNVYDPDKNITLDADAIKEMLPGYGGWNAQAYHEESSHLFDKITKLAKDQGLNIVHDATLKTPEKAEKHVDHFNEAGYDVHAHYMHLPRHEAANRAIHRSMGRTGRYVPARVVLGNTQNEESFDRIKHKVKAWSFRDNNVKNGTEPHLIAERKAGE